MNPACPAHALYTRLSRRRLLGTVAVSATGAILAACGTTEAPTASARPATQAANAAATMPAPTTAPATSSAPSPAAAVSPRPRGTSKGELRVGVGIHFPGTLDTTKDGFTLIFAGAAETLTRLTPAGKLEPWLAQSVTTVNATTWRVTLRPGVAFWDGTPVDAAAVQAAFQKNWEAQPGAAGLIAKETQIAIKDAGTLEFTPPRPTGDFPFSLASQYFTVFKPGANGSILTGPYRPTKFVTDQELTLEAYADHWGGTPPIAKITFRQLTDANARSLALQAGELDMLDGLPPEILRNFGPDIETNAIPSTRIHFVILNHARAPFADRAVREATALGIDRAVLLKLGLDGKGAVATGMFPTNFGQEVLPLQATDIARAKELLDDAGWKLGADGVRAKEGKRLAFTLYSYPGRAELTPMAISMQAQLKPLGYDIKLQEVQNITNQIKDGNFDMAMNSINTLVTGDPLYLFNYGYIAGSGGNYGKYTNPQLDVLVGQLRTEPDPMKRQALSRQAQEIVRADVPNIQLVEAPLVSAAKKGKVLGYVPHPSDLYFINTGMSVT